MRIIIAGICGCLWGFAVGYTTFYNEEKEIKPTLHTPDLQGPVGYSEIDTVTNFDYYTLDTEWKKK